MLWKQVFQLHLKEIFEAVTEISKILKTLRTPCGLARALKNDLEKCV